MAEISLVFASELYTESGDTYRCNKSGHNRLLRLGINYMSILDTLLSIFVCLKFSIIKIFFS